MSTLQEKETKLRKIIRNYQSMVIAYSGGVDSSLLAKLATEELGEQAWVVIADSPSLPRHELEEARQLAQDHGFNLKIVTTEEMNDENYLENQLQRCYHCKKHLYRQLKKIQMDNNLQVIVNGDNWSDLNDFRPGGLAAKENQIHRPLQEVKLEKEEIRLLAKKLSLPNHQKPSSPCLASRIPHGSRVNLEKLKQIEDAEFFLKNQLGIHNLRVRHHDSLATIETEEKNFSVIKKYWKSICDTFKSIGFLETQLNPRPLQSGSLTKDYLEKLGIEKVKN